MVALGHWVWALLGTILIIPWAPQRVPWDSQMVAASATYHRGLWVKISSTPCHATSTTDVKEYNAEPPKETERFGSSLTVDKQTTVSTGEKHVRKTTHHKFGMEDIDDAKNKSVTTCSHAQRGLASSHATRTAAYAPQRL